MTLETEMGAIYLWVMILAIVTLGLKNKKIKCFPLLRVVGQKSCQLGKFGVSIRITYSLEK